MDFHSNHVPPFSAVPRESDAERALAGKSGITLWNEFAGVGVGGAHPPDDSVIRSFYLKKERPRITDLHRRIAVECHRHDLPCPSYKAVWQRIQNLDPALVVRQREGAKAAKERFNAVLDGPQPRRPLDLYQIDHTLADVIVVDDVDRKPRYTMVDDHSRRRYQDDRGISSFAEFSILDFGRARNQSYRSGENGRS